jgi:hypothetical protein
MLARRKQKPRDNEPLVPHGMISQSLEAPQPLENVVPSQPKPPSSAVATVKRPPARILDWPQTERQIRNGLAEGLSVLARRLQRTFEHFQISRWTLSIRNFVSTRTRRITGTFAVIPARLRRALESVHVSTKAARICKFAWTYANTGLLWCRNWSGRTLVYFRGLHSSRRLQEMLAPERFEEKAAHAGSRVRIQLSGIPLQIRIALARASSGWAMRREALSRNSQLWTSLTMGALSSLLLMGIFLTARHYAKASLPSSHIGDVSPREAGATVAPSAIPIKSRPLKPISANRALQRATANPEAKSHETRRTATTPRKRPHTSEDEDYVAKDTYVYYGNTNASRQTKPAKD